MCNWIPPACPRRFSACATACGASRISIISCNWKSPNMKHKARNAETVILDDNPRWYKDAVIYEVHVRAYCDGNGDGIGDIIGLTEKLDYLHDLGVTALWLLPFYPSPLRDDGYDIADYTAIH